MQTTRTTAEARSAPAGGTGRILLVASAFFAPAVLALALATGTEWLMLLAAAAVGAAAWSLADPRVAILLAVLLATFVDYNTGRLTLELLIVSAWVGWTAVILLWRSAWKRWILPPRAMLPGLAVWLGACGLGVVVGLLGGNPLRNLGLELAAALWPLAGLAVMQVYGRRSLAFAGMGLVAIGLAHAVFGIAMLGVHQQRLGGIYFTTVTGIVAVGLWTATLLAPKRWIRVVCLAAMMPLLAHLLLSFTRGYWIGFAVAVPLATLLASRSLARFDPAVRFGRLALLPGLLLLIAAVMGLSALAFGRADLLESFAGRFASSFSIHPSGETLSNLIRLDEYDRAISAALESPIIGRGFGFAFVTRDLFTRTAREQWFVHNYYILLWLKLGLVGIAAFGYLLGSWVRAAARLAGREGDWLVRAWAITAIAMTAQVLVILVTNYSLADVNTASIVGCVWGVFWSIRPGGRS